MRYLNCFLPRFFFYERTKERRAAAVAGGRHGRLDLLPGRGPLSGGQQLLHRVPAADELRRLHQRARH